MVRKCHFDTAVFMNLGYQFGFVIRRVLGGNLLKFDPPSKLAEFPELTLF